MKDGKVYGVYTHSSPDGNVFYVGKGTEQRALKLFRKHNEEHRNIVSKYGASNIAVRFMPCQSEKEALLEEKRLIAELRGDGINLSNRTSSGQGTSGFAHSAASKEKMRRAQLGRRL